MGWSNLNRLFRASSRPLEGRREGPPSGMMTRCSAPCIVYLWRGFYLLNGYPNCSIVIPAYNESAPHRCHAA